MVLKRSPNSPIQGLRAQNALKQKRKSLKEPLKVSTLSFQCGHMDGTKLLLAIIQGPGSDSPVHVRSNSFFISTLTSAGQ